MISVKIKNPTNPLVEAEYGFESFEAFELWNASRIKSNCWGMPEEYFFEIQDVTEATEQDRINQESLAYLASTDWIVIRSVDEGIPVPEDIKAKRQESRLKIKR